MIQFEIVYLIFTAVFCTSRRRCHKRQATKSPKAERRKPRIHRTGRNQQFNAKATAETISRVYKQADEMKVTLGEWMKRAADALDREGAAHGRSTTS
jgi:hypothetical protein